MKELINNVLNSSVIEFTFTHIGFPAWTHETWVRQDDSHFKCVSEAASNYSPDASGNIMNNHEMFKFIKKYNCEEDCKIEIN